MCLCGSCPIVPTNGSRHLNVAYIGMAEGKTFFTLYNWPLGAAVKALHPPFARIELIAVIRLLRNLSTTTEWTWLIGHLLTSTTASHLTWLCQSLLISAGL